jgi:hypothetical protein
MQEENKKSTARLFVKQIFFQFQKHYLFIWARKT